MGMALDEPKENEQPVNVNGINVLVEDEAMPLVEDTTIDYINHPDGEGFIITGSKECC